MGEQIAIGSSSSKPGIQMGTRKVSSGGLSGATSALSCSSDLSRDSSDKFVTPEASRDAATVTMRNAANTRLELRVARRPELEFLNMIRLSGNQILAGRNKAESCKRRGTSSIGTSGSLAPTRGN